MGGIVRNLSVACLESQIKEKKKPERWDTCERFINFPDNKSAVVDETCWMRGRRRGEYKVGTRWSVWSSMFAVESGRTQGPPPTEEVVSGSVHSLTSLINTAGRAGHACAQSQPFNDIPSSTE